MCCCFLYWCSFIDHYSRPCLPTPTTLSRALQVGEKRQDNSGMMQGQLIKRTHIPKPVFDANGWGVVNPSDAPNGTASLLKANDPPPVSRRVLILAPWLT